MNNFSKTLYLEISKLKFVFFVSENDKQNNLKKIYELEAPIQGFDENRISDFEKFFISIKEKIYLIEEKLSHTFKEIVLILENFDPTFINISGYKKLNGSQISKENIIYILNTLKSHVNEIEFKKTILHIFNSKFNLDNKKIENLPIGLFGDFYAHELSFVLIKENDYKNLKYIFDKCNLKIKKILLKSFVEGARISENNKNIGTFFKIKINHQSSKIFLFENNSLKIEQNFKFGSDMIIKDISKVTSLKKLTIERILKDVEFNNKIKNDENIDKDLFGDDIYKKIKKKLIYDIAFARIKEIYEIILKKNINFEFYNKSINNIFLEINDNLQKKSLEKIYELIFTSNNKINIKFLDETTKDGSLKTIDKLVHFGWKKEAIPVFKFKKSIIARFFEALFG